MVAVPENTLFVQGNTLMCGVAVHSETSGSEHDETDEPAGESPAHARPTDYVGTRTARNLSCYSGFCTVSSRLPSSGAQTALAWLVTARNARRAMSREGTPRPS